MKRDRAAYMRGIRWEKRQGLRIPLGISEYDRSFYRALEFAATHGGPSGYRSCCDLRGAWSEGGRLRMLRRKPFSDMRPILTWGNYGATPTAR